MLDPNRRHKKGWGWWCANRCINSCSDMSFHRTPQKKKQQKKEDDLFIIFDFFLPFANGTNTRSTNARTHASLYRHLLTKCSWFPGQRLCCRLLIGERHAGKAGSHDMTWHDMTRRAPHAHIDKIIQRPTLLYNTCTNKRSLLSD